MVSRLNPKTNDLTRNIRVTTEVHVEQYVEAEVEIELDEFVDSIDDEGKAALLTALQKGGNSVHAEEAYYAFHQGNMDKVREFLCEMAGKIA